MFKNITYAPQTSFTPYPDDMLPDGFRYPQGYLGQAKALNYPRYFLWDFVDYDEFGTSEWDLRLSNKNNGWLALANVDPTPFARNGDFAAYFDGKDHSGDPKVVVVDLGNTVYGREYANFEAWLEQAFKDSKTK